MTALSPAGRPHPLLRSPSAAALIALLLRVVCLMLTHVYENGSQVAFQSWGLESLLVANSLATGHGFANAFPHYVYTTAWLAPVYPWLLSFGFLLFRLQGHAVTIFAQTLNVLFSALTCYPIYHLGKKTFDVRTGAAAAWLWAFLPTAILMPIAWTWDQSLSALLLATLLAFTYALRRAGLPLYWVAYGLLWGVAALTNPSLCVVMPFLWLWLWFQRWEAGLPSVALLARAALFFALAIAPWTVRNYIELGSPVFGKSNFGLEFWLGNNPTVKDVFSPDLHPMWNYDEYRQLVLEGEPRYNRAKAEQARAFIKAHPTRFLVLCGHRLLDMWTGIYESDLGTYLKPLGLSRIFIWYTTAFSLVAFVGFLSVARECAMDSLPLILCFVIFPIPYYITHSSLRYRHPIDPVLTLFCVVAVSGLTAFFGRRKELISHRSIQHQRKEPALP